MSAVNVQVAEDKDWFLQELVKMANTGVQFGITLQIGGILVTGVLVSGDQYFDAFANDWAGGFKDKESVEPIRQRLADLGSSYKITADDKNERPPPTFIHLKDAKFLARGDAPIPTNRGVWWRGRISEVAGFTLGTLNASPARLGEE